MRGRASITLGPVLFHWQPEAWRDFYARIADEAAVDHVFVGEVVCSKRMPFFYDLVGEVMDRLERAGKSVILSTLAMPTTVRERRLVRDLIAGLDRLVEVNDVSTLSQLAGRPHVIGPFINTYNEATLAYFARRGACAVCLPVELPLESIRKIASANRDVAVEVFAFGRSPLAISARCYHARAHGLTKDGCQFVCRDDTDGLAIETLDGQTFLSLNGIQTLSWTHLCLLPDIPQLIEAGVSSFRLSPHTCDMVAVSNLYRDVVDGRCEPGAAGEGLDEGPEGGLGLTAVEAGAGEAGGQVGAERGEGEARLRHGLDHDVGPGPAHHAQCDVQRRLVCRASRMIEPPWAVEQIACMQRELARHRPGSMLAGFEDLSPQRKHDARIVQGPQLGSRDLENEHVVAVEVRLETLRMRWRKIDVRLKMAAESLLDRAAEGSKRRQAIMQL